LTLGRENDMGKMNIVLKDETEERFRDAVYQTKGMKKGNISEAIEEALEDWMDKAIKENTRQTQKKQ
jgi:hypothetical protein